MSSPLAPGTPSVCALPALDVQALVTRSIIADLRSAAPDLIREIRAHLGTTAHVARVADVLYLPDLGLQVVGHRVVPNEGIVYPLNLPYLQAKQRGQDAGVAPPYSAPFEATYVDEEVCVLSNMFSRNFSHFTEELLKVLLLERAGYSPRYVYTSLPAFAFAYWDALGMDRRRLMQVPEAPMVFRSALYPTNLNFDDLSACPDVFFELRERMLDASRGITSPCGPRLWLDRGGHTSNGDRGVVNEADVQACLAGYGFTRLDIGSLPLLEQIAAARDAEAIAGPHGSAFLHSMYIKPGSTVIEAFSPLLLNGYSFEICRVLKHKYRLLVDYNAPQWPYAHGLGVLVNIPQLRLALQELGPR